MNFCPACGHAVQPEIPAGDNRLRHVCTRCREIHYQNPKVVVGTVPIWEDRVLLCRRAIEPRHGFWTLPAGFLENGETMADGALRETQEEAGAQVALQGLYAVIDVPHVHQVHVFYRARVLHDAFDPGTESLEVRLFREDEIDWSTIAFPTVARTLRAYWQDRSSGQFVLHESSILVTRDRALNTASGS